jgi:hypothetical protein
MRPIRLKNIELVKTTVLVWKRPNLFMLSSYLDPAPPPFTKNSQKWPPSYWTFTLVCLSSLSVRGRGLRQLAGMGGGDKTTEKSGGLIPIYSLYDEQWTFASVLNRARTPSTPSPVSSTGDTQEY